MVNQSQLDAVKKLVQTSGHLSPKERDEWLSLLPFMSDKQLSDLAAILQTQGPEPEPRVPQSGAAVQTQGQKPALPAAPLELDLPAPGKPVPAPAQALEADYKQNAVKDSTPPRTGANSVSDFINRNFAATLHRAPAASGQDVKLQPVAAPAPPVVVPPAAATTPVLTPAPKQVISAPTKAETPEPSAAFKPAPAAASEEVVATPKTLEDIRRLNTATLRGRGVLTIEGELKALCKKFGYFSVLFSLEHSPLYQTYTAVGARVLKDGQSFEHAEESLAHDGRPYLTKPEFEEVNDLLQHIKSA